jgi:mitochondrial-processing peptidase subunit beta
MSMAPTEAEVERAKSQFKAATLLTLSDDGTKSIVEDIARNIFHYGTRLTPKQVEEAIDAITVDDIMRVAQTYLWDAEIAVAAMGQTEGLHD